MCGAHPTNQNEKIVVMMIKVRRGVKGLLSF
jgi:hypothetical protein